MLRRLHQERASCLPKVPPKLFRCLPLFGVIALVLQEWVIQLTKEFKFFWLEDKVPLVCRGLLRGTL